MSSLVARENVAEAYERPMPADAARLIEEYRVDELVPFVREVGGNLLLEHAERLRRQAKPADALVFYRGYLRLFPFGNIGWDQSRQEEWSRAAIAYVEIADKLGNIDSDTLIQSRDALPAYQRLREAYGRSDSETYTRLTDEILAKYPRSIFPAAAVMTVAYGRGVENHGGKGFENIVDELGKYLDRMAAAGVVEQDRLPVMLMRHELERLRNWSSGNPGPLPKEVDVLRLSKNPLVRRRYLREQMKDALASDDPARIRRTIRLFLAEHTERLRGKARTDVIECCLGNRQRAEALRRLDYWKRSGVALDELRNGHLSVAADFVWRKDWNAALDHYQQASAGDAPSHIVAYAHLEMARVYRTQGLDQPMLDCLRRAAAIEPVDTESDIKDASDIRNEAYERLAQYFLEQEEWMESLTWWKKWHASRWCGDAMETRRAAAIVLCERKLREAGVRLPGRLETGPEGLPANLLLLPLERRNPTVVAP